jgi:hypothetical protein
MADSINWGWMIWPKSFSQSCTFSWKKTAKKSNLHWEWMSSWTNNSEERMCQVYETSSTAQSASLLFLSGGKGLQCGRRPLTYNDSKRWTSRAAGTYGRETVRIGGRGLWYRSQRSQRRRGVELKSKSLCHLSSRLMVSVVCRVGFVLVCGVQCGWGLHGDLSEILAKVVEA